MHLTKIVQKLFFNLVSVSLPEIVGGDEVHLELEHLEELALLVNNHLGGDDTVCNLFGHYFRVKWEDVLVFGGKIHGGYSQNVDIFIL